MNRFKPFFVVIIFFSSLNLAGQSKGNIQPKKHKFSFYGGIGPNYYFNNLDVEKSQVHLMNYSLVGRFMWEPEHGLSLGIESGYYKLYSIAYSLDSAGSGTIANATIPLLLVVSMKFLKNYYANFSMGQGCLFNTVNSSNFGHVRTSTWSLADYGVAVGYKHVSKNRISIGAETKFFYSSKFKDSNLTIAFMCGYNF
jgi:hypothetical protein